MKRVLWIISFSLILVIGIFSFLLYKDISYNKVDSKEYDEKIQKIEKEILDNNQKIDSIKNENQEKVKLLELWEKELEKAKNY